MAYDYLGTDGKYVVTYNTFIITAHSVKIYKGNSASCNIYFEKQCSCTRTSM